MTDQPRDTGAQDEQERARAYLEQLKQLHAADLGYEMALSLVSFGSQKLGLTDDTAELRDLEDARLSIELLRALLDVLERHGGGVPAAELRDTLAQLQLAYAHAVQLSGAPEAQPAADDVAEAGGQEASSEKHEEPDQAPQAEPDGDAAAEAGEHAKPDAGQG